MTIQSAIYQKAGTDNRAVVNDGYASPSKAELEDLAKELHEVGEKSGKKDDYDKRLESLATQFLPNLNPEDQRRFMEVVLDGDKGAKDSWLQPARLDKLVGNGRISTDDRQRVLDSLQPAPASGSPSGNGNADPKVDPPGDVLSDGYREVGADDRFVYDDVKNVSYPGEYEDGWLRFETSDGGKYAVNAKNSPETFGLAERKYLDVGQPTVDAARGRAGLPSTAETDLFSLETSEEVDGHKLKVGDAAMKLMIDGIKGDKNLSEDGSQAQFVRLVEARSAVNSGKFVHPVYENRNIGVGGVTITESENLLKLESSDMQEMLDEGAVNQKLDALMRTDEISGMYQDSLTEAVGKVPEDQRKRLADQLAKVVESPDYVAEASKLPAWDKPRMQADVEDAVSQLSLLDPERAKGAGQTFALNALASDIDSSFADPDAIPADAKVDAVDAGLGAVKNGIDKAKLPFDLADKIDGFLKDGGGAAKEDFANLAADLGKEGFYTREDIDKVFDGHDFRSNQKETIRSLYDDLSSNGVLPAVTGAIGMASTVRGLVKDGLGETPEEKLATAGGLISMVGSLPDTTKLMGNLVKGIDGSALDLLGVDKSIKSNMDVETKSGNRAVFAIGDNVAGTEIPEAANVKNPDAVLDGLKKAAGAPDGHALGDTVVSRMSKSTLKVMSDYAGKAGGLLGVVTGGMDAASAFSGDESGAEKASAVLSVMSGTIDLAPDALKAGSKFVSAVGGKAAGAVAERVVGAITRGLGPVGLALTVASELVSVFVDDANDKKEAKEQYAWFSKLGEDGVTKGDWNLKYDYAVTTLAAFGNARSHIKNLQELRDADWGGRQAPKDRSLFDFHREEFADFKSKWEKDRGADTYVEFLDPGKRKADFKREKDHMDEVKAYMDSHPTYFPGYNDWVLDL